MIIHDEILNLSQNKAIVDGIPNINLAILQMAVWLVRIDENFR